MTHADLVTISGVTMTLQAARLVEFCGINVREDVRAMYEGDTNPKGLLADCLEGCEDEATELLWRDYVSAVCVAAGVAS